MRARSETPAISSHPHYVSRTKLYCQRLVQRVEPRDAYKPARTVFIALVRVVLKDGVSTVCVARAPWGRILSARTAVGGPPTLKIPAGVARAPLSRFPSKWNHSPRILIAMHMRAVACAASTLLSQRIYYTMSILVAAQTLAKRKHADLIVAAKRRACAKDERLRRAAARARCDEIFLEGRAVTACVVAVSRLFVYTVLYRI